MEAEVNRTEVPAWYCDRKTNGYRLLFLALNEAARPACFVDELLVSYDASTGRCECTPHLESPGHIRARTGFSSGLESKQCKQVVQP